MKFFMFFVLMTIENVYICNFARFGVSNKLPNLIKNKQLQKNICINY